MLIGLIGPADEKWDICFIAEYLTVESFVLMQRDKTYQKAVAHRQIVVKTSRLIRMAPKKLEKTSLTKIIAVPRNIVRAIYS